MRILAVLACLAWAPGLLAGPRPGGFGPWSADPRHPAMAPVPPADAPPTPARTGRSPSGQPRASRGPAGSPFGLAFGFWQAALTRIDGPRCSHRPTCSAFGHRAVARYGLPLGFWITLSRLSRAARSSAIRTLPAASVPGQVFFVDRLSDYTFWRADYSPWSGRNR